MIKLKIETTELNEIVSVNNKIIVVAPKDDLMEIGTVKIDCKELILMIHQYFPDSLLYPGIDLGIIGTCGDNDSYVKYFYGPISATKESFKKSVYKSNEQYGFVRILKF